MTDVTRVRLPMPRLGETMEQGTISNWLIAPGDSFARGEPLLELETDKTLVEYPALGAGKLIETLVQPGDIVDVGAPIAIIESSDVWDAAADAPKSEDKPDEAGSASMKPEAQAPKSPVTHTHVADDRLRATPLARRLARRGGVDLAQVSGQGRRGRIEADDVERHINDGAGTSHPVSPKAHLTGHLNTVLFIHGFAGLGSNWAALRAKLQRNGLETMAPDLPGHGKNDADANDVEDCIRWLEDLLNAQEQPVHLVGHSLGAHVAALAAERAHSKVGRLTLLAPAGCGHDINGGFLQGMAHARSPGELAHLLRLLGPTASKLPSDAMHAMAKELAKGRLTTLANAVARGDIQCIDTISAAAELSQNMPVDAIFGIADRIIPKEHMFNMPPQVAAHIVRTGHMPHWDAPALMERLISQTN
jgi:pyruvate dehydrogenase E2 component (dihydrolipoamide acetyltransferase)